MLCRVTRLTDGQYGCSMVQKILEVGCRRTIDEPNRGPDKKQTFIEPAERNYQTGLFLERKVALKTKNRAFRSIFSFHPWRSRRDSKQRRVTT